MVEKSKHISSKSIIEKIKNLVLVGDFNIVPSELDAHNFSSEDILCSDEERKSLKEILKLGLNDCFSQRLTKHHIRGGIIELALFIEILVTE